jgi:hypothetical protein
MRITELFEHRRIDIFLAECQANLTEQETRENVRVVIIKMFEQVAEGDDHQFLVYWKCRVDEDFAVVSDSFPVKSFR